MDHIQNGDVGRINKMKNNDTLHLKILAVFHYLVGVYFLLGSLFISRYVLAGVLAFIKSNGTASPSESFTSWGQVILISMLVLLVMAQGIALLFAGHFLRQQKSRIFCLVIAGIECLSFPLGTVLGVFTLIKLSKASVKERFAQQNIEPAEETSQISA